MSRLSQGPSDAAVTPVASEGILSAESQAKIATARTDFLSAIAEIKDPATRFRAFVSELTSMLDAALPLASAYPGAAPFVSTIRQALSRITAKTAAAKIDQ